MLGRLWIVLSLFWAMFWFRIMPRDADPEGQTACFFIAIAPLIIGPTLARIARWVVQGD